MPSGVRANSLLVVATPSVLVRSLDEAVEYLDHDGVPRRRVCGVDARRLVLRGSSLSSLDTVRAIYDQQELQQDSDQEGDGHPQHPAFDEGDDVYSSTKRLEEKLALERTRQANMLRRQQMIRELYERKRSMLVAQHEAILERVQLWNDALALDPEAELTSAHTMWSPSSKARAFIDEDGNVRRKSYVENDSEAPGASSLAAKSPATAASVLTSIAGSAALSPRKSLVLEFMQILLED